jgi:hypothetical protein
VESPSSVMAWMLSPSTAGPVCTSSAVVAASLRLSASGGGLAFSSSSLAVVVVMLRSSVKAEPTRPRYLRRIETLPMRGRWCGCEG